MLCHDICPNQAINPVEDDLGYLQPQIIKEVCTYCGKCKRNCPVNSNQNTIEEKSPLALFAAWHVDNSIRRQSTSGGIFAAFAKTAIDSGGIAFGAQWSNSLRVNHSACNNLKDLQKLQGTKYIQSNAARAYLELCKEAQDKIVLFSGTPCQCSAAMKMAELKKVTDNVVTCEILCYGVPSYHLVDAHARNVFRKHRSAVNSISFRDKQHGWLRPLFLNYLQNGKMAVEPKQNLFYLFYLTARVHRPACTNCKFAKLPRCADITIGDYWGMKEWPLEAKNGVSFAIINSANGMKFWNKASPSITSHAITLNKLLSGNPRLISGILPTFINTQLIVHDLAKKDIRGVAFKYMKMIIIKRIVRFIKIRMQRILSRKGQ
jgi:coenzyme F420-reducing hydrogenase beta subunit